ncbi:hypothetical protein BHE74_00043958 [Ensete ventricosum]|nr:hypothetical protein BHE74_00043958 [Ensete ventricosum]RZS14754.1 hypothetical protein BHM03_00046508 [Ensete ventricosum]
MSSSGSSSDRSTPSASSEGTRSDGPEASVSGSSFSGMPSPIDVKSLRDLEVMKSCHDITSVIIEEPLELIWKRYSIPKEYVLQAPLSKQRLYNPKSSKLSISMDALEAGLEIVYPCIPDSDGEDEGGQASSSLAVSTR